ncbi:MAG: O-antigen ligase family protein [Candidatus Moranbacteria bacterium]|nr:O-antigen ligase family protein [Candidatus Moranbacteria bacterium]
MIAYLEQFVKQISRPKSWLILANVLLVFFLILLNNLHILPLRMGDFLFFAFLTLAFALYRPGWAFLFFIGTIALENINLAPAQLGMALRPYQFIGALTMLALIIRFIFKRLNFELPKLKWFDALIGIIVIAGFLSTLNAPDKILSFKLSIIIFSFSILYLLSRIYIQTFEDLKRIVPFFLSSSVIVILYGVWQNIRFIYGGSNFETMPGRPNATFAEADWLGIFIVFCLAVIYVIVYYCHSELAEESNPKISNFSRQSGTPPRRWQIPISNKITNSKFQIPIRNSKFSILNSFLHILLTTLYIILILTVSRSAWLGAGFVTIIFLFIILTNLKFNPKNWQFRCFLKTLTNFAIAIFVSFLLIYIFHLTNFQLFNRAQSSGGLQKITIACEKEIALPNSINNISELAKYNCRHINLENIAQEKAAGQFVTEIYRTDPNVNIRQIIYQKSWEQINNHLILGIGWGSIGKILGADERGAALNSSNIFLEVWLGSGILGIISFVLIWIIILISGLRNFLKENPESKIFGLFLILSVFALLIPNLFNAGILLGILWLFWGASQIEF